MEKISIWDITKIIAAVAIAGFLWVQVNAIGDGIDRWLNKTSVPAITETQISRIAADIMHAQVVANKAQFQELQEKMAETDSRALEAAKELIKEQGGQISELGRVVGRLESKIIEVEADSIQRFKAPADDPRKELEIVPADRPAANGRMIPAGNMYVSPNMPKLKDRYVYTPAPLDFYFDIVHTQSPDGDYNKGGVTVSMAVESPTMPTKDKRGNYVYGEKFPVKINSFEYARTPITKKSWMFNPRIGLGGALTNEFFAPQLDVSFWSYGTTKIDMDWRFVNIGMGGTTDKFVATFVPVSYNIGKFLPVVENIFLGPAFGVDSDSKTSYGGTLMVPF
ncbi:hypothetical protein DRQ25_01540 [Candidatus Fermentibacteria bacterium]|nr:MAG: hypothetical protein DRQ25_01540 [Candidatus Fermentibacteria bacterium]